MARLLRQGFRAGAPTTLSPTESASKSQGRFVTLDGMRGVAAALVVWFHMSQSGWVPMFGLPFLAVDLFFGLSGFVLAIAYDQRFQTGMSTFQFLKQRVIRLYPMYFLGLALGTLALLPQVASDKITVVRVIEFTGQNIFLVPAFFTSDLMFPALLVAWSLFFELIVNAVYAATRRFISGYRLIFVVGIAAILLVVATVHAHNINSGAHFLSWKVSTARAFFSFFMGVLVARIFGLYPFRVKIPSWLMLLAVAVLLLLPVPQSLQNRYGLACILVVFPAMLYAGANGVERRPWIGRGLGDTSYVLYAIHLPLLAFATMLLAALRIDGNPVIAIALLIVATVLAFVIHHFVDEPVRFWLRAKLSPRRAF